MLVGQSGIRGATPNKKNFNDLTNLLYSQGYNDITICKELHISPSYYYRHFSNPSLFSLARLQMICFMSGKTMPYVINLCLKLTPKSIHWLDENSLSPEEVVKGVKRRELGK